MKKITFILATAILSGCSATSNPNVSGQVDVTSEKRDMVTEVYPFDGSLTSQELTETNVETVSLPEKPVGGHSLDSYLTSVNSLMMVDQSMVDDMQSQLLKVIDEEYKGLYVALASQYKSEMTAHLDSKNTYESPTYYLDDIRGVESLLTNSGQLSDYEVKELTLNLDLLKAKQMELELSERYDFEVHFSRVKSNLRYSFQKAKFELELNHMKEVSLVLAEGEMSQYYGEKLSDIRLSIVALEVAIESLEADVFGWGDDQLEEPSDAESEITINEELF